VKPVWLLAPAGAVLLLSACASAPIVPPVVSAPTQPGKTLVLLLADPGGGVGAVEVGTQGGSRSLSTANHVVRVDDPSTTPGAPAPLSEVEIQRIFGAALTGMPPAPALFILTFEEGSAALTADSTIRLPEIIEAIAARAPADVTVVGHTDTAGDATRNQELGLLRARSVASLLISRGADAGTITADSHGEGNPLVPTPDGVKEARNRRVEVTVR
jgi:outer membrane protein OmpA-like peptidoglycan-associated protein